MLAGLAVWLGCCGCRSEPKAIPVRTRVSVGKVLANEIPIRFYANGREIKEVHVDETPGAEAWIFEADGSAQGAIYTQPSVVAQVLTPCGWREVALQPATIMVREYSPTVPEEHAEYYYPSSYTEQVFWFWVDNRDGDEAEVRLGQAAYRLPAHKATQIMSYLPVCPEGGVVRFDGQEMGSVSREQLASRGPAQPTLFIDPTGKRCYNHRNVHYQAEELGPFTQAKPTRLSGQRLYVLPDRVTYMLEAAPSQEMSTSDELTKDVAELTDTRCR